MTHISKKELINYVLRNEFPLPSDKEDLKRDHLAECETCLVQWKELETRRSEIKLSKPPELHFCELKVKLNPETTTKTWPMWLKAAAVVAVLISGYGSTVWWVNYQFDHGPMGLAAFEEDYKFAISKESYRGENKEEPEDISLFKEGVKTLFEAKRTTFGLFPRYDISEINKAKDILALAKSKTKNQELIDKVNRMIEMMK